MKTKIASDESWQERENGSVSYLALLCGSRVKRQYDYMTIYFLDSVWVNERGKTVDKTCLP